VRVGVVGHRSLSVEATAFAETVCARLFADLRLEGTRLTAVSALAQGADTLFARVAVASGVPLAVVQPHGRYLDDFPTRRARAEYVRMTKQACAWTLMPYRGRCDMAYQAAMEWVADHSDVLVAIWDGRPSRHCGGTAGTVGYARETGCPVVHVDPRTRSVALV
jgi:hypothetical protein